MLRYVPHHISKRFWVAGTILGLLCTIFSYSYTYQGQPNHLWPGILHHFGSMIDYDTGEACDLSGTVPFNVSYGWPLPYWGQSGTFNDSGCGRGISRIMPVQFIIDAILFILISFGILYLMKRLYQATLLKIKRRRVRRLILALLILGVVIALWLAYLITSETPIPFIGCLPDRQLYSIGTTGARCMTPQENVNWSQQVCLNGLCPICLSQNTMIATPDGPKQVTHLRAGELVWSITASGQRMSVPIVKTTRRHVPDHTHLLDVALADGRHLLVSPNHPTASYVLFKYLRPGETLDGSTIMSIASVDYSGSYTYDLLPESPTGDYWANNILVGSTLKELQ